MKSQTWISLLAGLFLFAVCVAAAFIKQSAYMLYFASLLPVFIVPFLPDMPSRQKIKPQGTKNITLYKQPGTNEAADLLIIEFNPGSIKWNKQLLYFHADEQTLPTIARYKSDAAALSVLKYDLVARKRKPMWFGIRLQNLAERASSFSFTTAEVTRIVIQLQDLREIAQSKSFRSTATQAKDRQVGRAL